MDGKNYRNYTSVAKLLITVKIFNAYVLNVD